MPDGRRLVFGSLRSGTPSIFIQPADGTGTAEPVTQSTNIQYPSGVTPDGKIIIYEVLQLGAQRDVRLVTLGATTTVTSLVATGFDERGGTVSPDGRWLAYESNSSGRSEICVKPFPAVNDGFWQVSRAGGTQAHWSHSGRELFFVAPDGAIMGVPVDMNAKVWQPETPTPLVTTRYFHSTSTNLTRQYDLSKDDRRFLVIKEQAPDPGRSVDIVLVQNWTEELKGLVPTR
jgi:serine/threonine-protein kinase